MRILIALFREILKWDRPSQIALAIAFVLLALDLFVLSTQPDLQTPALIGAVGLLLGIQGIFMWGNRNLVTPITQAQREMVAGDFQSAVITLTQYIEKEAHSQLDALILLGNAYRNLGDLDNSELWLQRALERRVDNHFALYSLGKTALAQGDYQFAIDHFQESLANGGHQIAQFDLAHAYFRLNDYRQTVNHLQKMPDSNEPYRKLFETYMLQTANANSDELVWDVSGLPFWEAEAQRFAHTPYGQAIAHDVENLRKIL